MPNLHFYRDLPVFTDFDHVLDQENYTPLPEDWYIAIADIRNSTGAIDNGLYKDVNTVGASCIIAVLNEIGDATEIPYVFGGDGASFAIPPELLQESAKALLGVKKMAIDSFGLDLRIAIIPLSAIKKSGKNIRAAKYELSAHAHIAMLSGGGMSYADYLAKAQEKEFNAAQYISAKTNIEADLSGLECRWQAVKAEHGQILTLLVMAMPQSAQNLDDTDIYKSLLPRLNKILNDEDGYCPVSSCRLKLTKNIKNFRQELRARNYEKNILKKCSYFFLVMFEAFLGTILFTFDITAGQVKGKAYIDDVIRQSDFQKFDDMIRMVVDCSDTQTEQLQNLLEEDHQKGRIYYGIHKADSALITCMVFCRLDEHMHFIDGAAGGYALAARNMKEQIKTAEDSDVHRQALRATNT